MGLNYHKISFMNSLNRQLAMDGVKEHSVDFSPSILFILLYSYCLNKAYRTLLALKIGKH
jgi:hypothetical protein